MSAPRLLDLYCGVGGASVGYAEAGFTVTGIDHLPQPNYPLTFIQADALAYLRKHGDSYDVVAASPPCQRYSYALNGRSRDHHPDLLGPTRDLLQQLGMPYVIENVPGAPLVDPTTLCGVMFGLYILRHRLFESLLLLPQPHHPRHQGTVVGGQYLSVAGNGGDSVTRKLGHWRDVLEIPWAATHTELVNAIPPAYTRWVGRQLLVLLGTPSPAGGAG